LKAPSTRCPSKIRSLLLAPLLVTALTAVVLRLLNGVPSNIQGPAVQQFASVEQAQSRLGVDILLPPYFPDYFAWPPEVIEATSRPSTMVRLVFTARHSGSEALWLFEAFSPDARTDASVAYPATIVQKKTFPVDGKQGLLVVGTDADGMPLYQLRWEQDNRYLVVSTSYSLEEMVRMANSMAR